MAALALGLARRKVPEEAASVLAAASSFAAVSTLLGSPLLGAFLLMEASGLGGPTLGLVLVPGLLASGIGSLIFIGLDSLTGLGTFSLAIPGLPHFARPDVAEFGWAIVIGLAAALLGRGIRFLGGFLKPYGYRSTLLVVPLAGITVGVLGFAFAEWTGKPTSEVLFSGESQPGPLITHASSYGVGALVLLLAFKGLAYGVSLGSFRGGPVFPGMFLGAAGGIAMSHLPGLPLVPAAAMGIGAMSVVMLTLPLTSVLLATLLLLSDGLAVMPVVIVAVVVAYVAHARLTPQLATQPDVAKPREQAPASSAGAHPAHPPQSLPIPMESRAAHGASPGGPARTRTPARAASARSRPVP